MRAAVSIGFSALRTQKSDGRGTRFAV